MRIYLVGFMGSGKTSLGSAAAAELHVPFIDTDALIEASEQMAIPDIFAEKGELHFRELEAQVLTGTVLFPKALIATGGGMPCHGDHMERMRHAGITIYLEWAWELLYPLLKQQTASRPLLAETRTVADWKKVEALFHQRRHCYEQAAMTIEMTDDLNRNLEMLIGACNYIWK